MNLLVSNMKSVSFKLQNQILLENKKKLQMVLDPLNRKKYKGYYAQQESLNPTPPN